MWSNVLLRIKTSIIPHFELFLLSFLIPYINLAYMHSFILLLQTAANLHSDYLS